MGIDVAHSLEAFQHDWSRHYCDALPLAYLLRMDCQRPWIRFHALPLSQRYAKNELEQLEILRRANTLGTELLGAGAECWLVQCRIEEYSKPYWEASKVIPEPCLRYPDPEEGFCWIATATVTRWQNGAFDNLLSKVAEETVGPTLWMSRANGAIFAPYDGGFDLFPKFLSEVDLLKRKHIDWLSSHPEGL